MIYYVQLYDGFVGATKMAVFTDRVTDEAKSRGILYALKKVDYFDKPKVKEQVKQGVAIYITSGQRTEFLKNTSYRFDDTKANLKRR